MTHCVPNGKRVIKTVAHALAVNPDSVMVTKAHMELQDRFVDSDGNGAGMVTVTLRVPESFFDELEKQEAVA